MIESEIQFQNSLITARLSVRAKRLILSNKQHTSPGIQQNLKLSDISFGVRCCRPANLARVE
jgi:hypothetical protein